MCKWSIDKRNILKMKKECGICTRQNCLKMSKILSICGDLLVYLWRLTSLMKVFHIYITQKLIIENGF